MNDIIKKSNKIIELEMCIKLMNYLKRTNTVGINMYNYCINRLIMKLELEKNKIDDMYIKDISNYQILV